MSSQSWTYELPPAGGDAEGLEQYVVYGRDGEQAGKVSVLLRKDSGLWLAVDHSGSPLTGERRAVPWDEVGAIDHASLAVWLTIDAAAIERRFCSTQTTPFPVTGHRRGA